MKDRWKFETSIKGFSHSEAWKEFFEEYCRNEITKMQLDKEPVLYVNVLEKLAHFREMNLMYALFNNPDEVLEHAREGLANIHHIFMGWEEEPKILKKAKIRFYNLPTFRRFRVNEIDHALLGKFIAVEGIVRKISEVKPTAVKAVFECTFCNETIVVEAEQRFLKKPGKCPICGKRKFRYLPEKSETTNFQRIEIQDLPENLEAGEQPRLLEVYLFDDLAGILRAGDKIILNGILRPDYKTIRSRGEYINADFNIYLEANSIEFIEEDIRNIQITSEDERKIKELAGRSDIYDLLVKSIAPSIYGYEDVKLAIGLALFGGSPTTRKDGTKVRGDIHILLVGDPGLAKTQLIRSAYLIAPRAILTTGYTSTGAGLTVTVTRDEDNRWTIEAGALVLADRGICVVDEIEKMRKEDRRHLLEALEQQTITIAKAGINATLNARCTVIASANPKQGRFNRYEPLVEQIDLEAPLLSRFDLIFILIDEPDEIRDSLIADHILSEIDREHAPAIDLDLLRKYVAYARQNVTKVRLSPEAKEKIKEFYTSLRSLAKSDEHGSIPITARQLEALIRLTQASARVRLSDVATAEDAERAIRLFKKCLEQIAIDPETGRIDIDYAITGVSASMRDKIAIIKEIIRDLENMSKYGAPEEDVIRVAEEKLKLSRAKIEEIVQKLKNKGEIYSPRYGYYRVVKS